jgi:hypothetical protein
MFHDLQDLNAPDVFQKFRQVIMEITRDAEFNVAMSIDYAWYMTLDLMAKYICLVIPFFLSPS